MNEKDTEIIRCILQGDARAYARLIDRHKDRAMTLALRMLKNRADAEEAVQDAFVRAFRALASFENKSSFATWFYRIVYNVCSTELAKRPSAQTLSFQAERGQGEDGPVLAEPVSEELPPDLEVEEAEFRAVVGESIAGMAAPYASILTLFFVQEMGYEEIAEVMGLPLGTVKNRLFRARLMLKKDVLMRLGEGSLAPGAQKENRP
ncbi:MAG: RNA polymerase sigma factor [Acidobacteriota bacterium]